MYIEPGVIARVLNSVYLSPGWETETGKSSEIPRPGTHGGEN